MVQMGRQASTRLMIIIKHIVKSQTVVALPQPGKAGTSHVSATHGNTSMGKVHLIINHTVNQNDAVQDGFYESTLVYCMEPALLL